MEKFIANYLRLLDIDPAGHFIRLINRSHQRTLDLNNVCIRQVNEDALVCNFYTFDEQSPTLLPRDEVVTIYSRDYRRLKFDIRPYIFIAKNLPRWSTDDRIRTELSLNTLAIDSQTRRTLTTDDVPCLFIQHVIGHKQEERKAKSYSLRPDEFHYPYCFSTDNIVNPHTRGNERRTERNSRSESKQNVKHFDEYPRRLTTAPLALRSSKAALFERRTFEDYPLRQRMSYAHFVIYVSVFLFLLVNFISLLKLMSK